MYLRSLTTLWRHKKSLQCERSSASMMVHVLLENHASVRLNEARMIVLCFEISLVSMHIDFDEHSDDHGNNNR